MDIVYASNDLYARHLAVSMISLFDRNQQAEEITVYVLSVGITEESRQKLQKIADPVSYTHLDVYKRQRQYQRR